jgi:uncharacterized protein involved in exopolysaccharide biosynthesis
LNVSCTAANLDETETSAPYYYHCAGLRPQAVQLLWMNRSAMTNEVIALSPSTSVGVLWSRRWTLVTAIATASIAAAAGASLLPKTWESQTVVQLGQVAGKPIERADVVVRKINVGVLQCGLPQAGTNPTRLDAVVARLDSTPELGEVRLVATGRTADEAHDQAARAAACLVERDRALFEAAQRRDAQFRAALEFQVQQVKSSLENSTQMLGRTTPTAGNAPEALLLQSRIEGARVQHLQLAKELRDLEADHQNDALTSVARDATYPSTPIWPRRALLAAFAGVLAFVLCSAVFLFGLAPPRPSERM